jgi:DNA-binding MarR family transcriptional regulator
MYKKVPQLRAEDLFVALELAVAEPGISGRKLASELEMPSSSVSVSIRRLRANNLVEQAKGQAPRVRRLALRECLQHAVRWIAPARVGGFVLGLPTAHASPALAGKFRGDPDPFVIPMDEGPVRGRAVSPLHPKASVAAARNPKLHALLAVVDALRVGGAREREIAAAELSSLL